MAERKKKKLADTEMYWQLCEVIHVLSRCRSRGSWLLFGTGPHARGAARSSRLMGS